MKQRETRKSGQQTSSIASRVPAGQQAPFTDNRGTAATQRKLANMIEQGTSAQRKQMKLISRGTAQRLEHKEHETVQGKADSLQRMSDQEDEPVQGRFAESVPMQRMQQDAPRANQTGLPDNLKSGIENLSGMSMDHVKVHYNSAQPAQLNAHAYAQGSDIHVAPGQEQHLPHEAWHVVQQAQGRVKPTLQMKSGVPVNDDAGLEAEADAMGAQAVTAGRAHDVSASMQQPAQRLDYMHGHGPVHQLLSEDQEGALAEYALAKVDNAGVYIPEKERNQAVANAAALHTGSKPKDLANAKKEFDTWLANRIPSKPSVVASQVGKPVKAESSVPVPKEATPEQDDSSDFKEAESASSIHFEAVASVAKAKKVKKPKPVSLSEFKQNTPSAPLNFGLAVSKAVGLPDPVAVVVKTKKSDAMIKKLEQWKPSQGHGGCSAFDLTTQDLQDIVDWASGKGKYFIKRGAGTGSYSSKDQLKIIHISVDDKASGKKATYHISANAPALDALNVVSSDDY